MRLTASILLCLLAPAAIPLVAATGPVIAPPAFVVHDMSFASLAVVDRTTVLQANLTAGQDFNGTIALLGPAWMRIAPLQQEVRASKGENRTLRWNVTALQEGFWSLQLGVTSRWMRLDGNNLRFGFSGRDEASSLANWEVGDAPLEYNLTAQTLNDTSIRVHYREGLDRPWARFMGQTVTLEVDDVNASASRTIATTEGTGADPPNIDVVLPLAEGNSIILWPTSTWTIHYDGPAWSDGRKSSCGGGIELRRTEGRIQIGPAPQCTFIQSGSPDTRSFSYVSVPWNHVGPGPDCGANARCDLTLSSTTVPSPPPTNHSDPACAMNPNACVSSQPTGGHLSPAAALPMLLLCLLLVLAICRRLR